MAAANDITKEEFQDLQLSQLSPNQAMVLSRHYRFSNKDITVREILEMYTSSLGSAYKQGLVHLNEDGSVKAIATPHDGRLSEDDFNDSTLEELQQQARLQQGEPDEKLYQSALDTMYDLVIGTQQV